MKSFISEFGLTLKQTCLLFSLERQIVLDDIMNSKVKKKLEEANQKQLWLDKWDTHLNEFLNHLGENQNVLIDITKVDPYKLYEEIENKRDLSEIKTWRYLILLECTLFTPYYSLGSNEDENESTTDKIKKIFNGLSLDESIQKFSLKNICTLLGIDQKYIDIFIKQYQQSLRSLSGFWTKVLIIGGVGMVAAVAAALFLINPIAGFFAAPGLAGAAAFSAGMAALGGGAIAAGGFGIAGGFAVLIGGAMVLGGGAGAGIGALASATPQIVLTELAKIQVVLKEIVLGIQKDTKLMQEIIMQLHNNVGEMQQEIIKLKLENDQNKEKIKNLEESIEYMKKVINEFTKK